MSAINSAKSISALAAIPGAADVISVQLAIWSSLTGVKSILAMGKKVTLPKYGSDGALNGALTDARLAAAALYECTVKRPNEMVRAQQEMEARARAAIQAEADAADRAQAEALLAQSEATTDEAAQALEAQG